MKGALITGVTGQDGSYLAEMLLEKGYDVHGIVRWNTTAGSWGAHTERRVEEIEKRAERTGQHLEFHYGDLTDGSSIRRVIREVEPDEIYNLGAQSHVAVSYDQPDYTAEVNALGTLRVLEAIRETGVDARFYQASTSELFGNATETPQDESTRFDPESPYASAKLYAHHITKNYRDAYDIFACNGILFNHESPRRVKAAVTRKISRTVARMDAGMEDRLYLGNLDAKRDWGYAPEYVEAMWEILNNDTPEDLVIATGETHTVREFATIAFETLGYEIEWQGEGVEERGIDADSGETLVEVTEEFFRPTDVHLLKGDASRAKQEIGWEPRTTFEGLVEIMVEADREALEPDRSEPTVLER
ncbi:GDP-mannose 4,6-dehydratase [Halalkalicoccus jeotgali B3]|uniref:GDP-mannose 4,6-dehydratase n=1 Tax=Halalkalicoccus jeotgali (strain DSM 18796 / CECT 7217 / JCM 14584 / KCTC 4019 / B3) TaxID=795797 RepID=D8J2F9_HALJB|nr:GDP-mannose 4,6-dehydratase [Halalkalicoccus jeotgali B3]ELY35068.1 GDP-mannose 4,6-dehydratase [Halalkalicoccus jeotgali B3]